MKDHLTRQQKLSPAILTLAVAFSVMPSRAVEITPYIGKMFAQDFVDTNGGDLAVDSGNSAGVSFAWEKGRHGQGQILINATSHRFATDTAGIKSKLDVIYAHFNGVAKFRQPGYITTVSIGVGGSYMKVKSGDSELSPSLTAAIGTRYVISKRINFVTELRSYMTLTDENSDIFCSGSSTCNTYFKSAIWTDTSVSIGLSYRF